MSNDSGHRDAQTTRPPTKRAGLARGRRTLDGFVLDCQAAAAFLGITDDLRAGRDGRGAGEAREAFR